MVRRSDCRGGDQAPAQPTDGLADRGIGKFRAVPALADTAKGSTARLTARAEKPDIPDIRCTAQP